MCECGGRDKLYPPDLILLAVRFKFSLAENLKVGRFCGGRGYFSYGVNWSAVRFTVALRKTCEWGGRDELYPPDLILLTVRF